MRTWYCKTCTEKLKKHTYHVDKGREGCEECKHYEARVEVPNAVHA